MSRRIAKLIDESEQTVAELLARLESQNGHTSDDVRHIAETHQKARQKMIDLNLDPADTTAEELYRALQIRFEADAAKVDRYYEADQKNFDERMALAVRLVNANMKLPDLWVLKKSAAKELLCAHAPKHAMKSMGYRSMHSMLKRQDVRAVYLLAEELESDSWSKAHNRLISKLDQSAFELRPVAVVGLDSDWTAESRPRDLIVASDNVGAVSVLPSDLTNDLPLLSILLLITDKLQAYGADCSEIYKISEIIGWWSETDNLITSLDDKTVSLNLLDAAASWLYDHSFEKRQLGEGVKNYWRSLLSRYDNKPQLEGVFDDSAISRVKQLKFKAPEPVFEYDFAEDFLDG